MHLRKRALPEASFMYLPFSGSSLPLMKTKPGRSKTYLPQGQIPGLLETHVGPNISPRGKGYTFGGIMRFKNQAALDAYVQHPAHQALLVWLVPLIDAIELDLRA